MDGQRILIAQGGGPTAVINQSLVGAVLAARGLPGVEVRADAFVAYNGRASARLIDPEVDLVRERDGLANKPWILPGPEEPPP